MRYNISSITVTLLLTMLSVSAMTALVAAADFSADPLTGNAPLLVHFTDLSSGAVSWTWNFGDGDPTNSTEQNPYHSYYSQGSYTVSLEITNDMGRTSSITKPGYITVAAPTIASFVSTPAAGYAPLSVLFNDTSTCDSLTTLTTWNWTFDGGVSWMNMTDPATRNVTHTFGAVGTYPVVLIVKDGNGGTNQTSQVVTALQPTISIDSIKPDKATIGNTVSALITGANFTSSPAMTATLTRGAQVITATNIKVTNPKKISCKFAIPLSATGGTWNLTVTRPDGDYGWKADAFTVNTLGNPKISSVNPTSAYVNTTFAFSLMGSNFVPGAVVTFSRSSDAITAVLDPITKTSKITGNLTTNISSPTGKWNVTIILPDGRNATKKDAITLKSWTIPVVSSIMPTSGYPNMTYTFSINGNLFESPGTVVNLTRGVPGESIPAMLSTISLKKITGTLYIPSGTATTKWNLSVTTPDGGTTIKNGAFTVKPWPAPHVASIVPTSATNGTIISYTLMGTNFQPGSSVTLTNSSAAGLNFTTTVSTLTQTKITGTYNVPLTARGKYGVEVNCPDGKVATKDNILTIK